MTPPSISSSYRVSVMRVGVEAVVGLLMLTVSPSFAGRAQAFRRRSAGAQFQVYAVVYGSFVEDTGLRRTCPPEGDHRSACAARVFWTRADLPGGRGRGHPFRQQAPRSVATR